jgi:tRNA(adenine34) deaminase
MNIKPEKKFMELAIEQAKLAYAQGDYPVGAVLVRDDKILSAQGNRIIRDENPIGHAEILAITDVTGRLKKRNLPPGCMLYVTHEPCPMCATLAVFARLSGLVFGARESDMKAFRLKNSQSRFRWHSIEIPCRDIFKSGKNIALVEEFMRDQCLQLFDL